MLLRYICFMVLFPWLIAPLMPFAKWFSTASEVRACSYSVLGFALISTFMFLFFLYLYVLAFFLWGWKMLSNYFLQLELVPGLSFAVKVIVVSFSIIRSFLFLFLASLQSFRCTLLYLIPLIWWLFNFSLPSPWIKEFTCPKYSAIFPPCPSRSYCSFLPHFLNSFEPVLYSLSSCVQFCLGHHARY